MPNRCGLGEGGEGSTHPLPRGLHAAYALGMWSESNNHGFVDEHDYLRSLKKDDSYTFTYSFEYIAKNHGNDNYDIATADMVVRVNWSDQEVGYVVAYDVPEVHKVDPSEGNSNAAGFFEYGVYDRLIDDLDGIGIGYELRAF